MRKLVSKTFFYCFEKAEDNPRYFAACGENFQKVHGVYIESFSYSGWILWLLNSLYVHISSFYSADF